MGGLLSTFFVSAPLLLGVAGAAIPFILHMVYRRRAPRVQFSTLRFIRESAERTARRRHIREWLLLLFRAAAIFLLAVGLAGPIFRTAGLGGSSAVSAALVMDNSYSMDAEWEQVASYARARDCAVRILGDLAANGQAAVVYVCPPPGGGRMADLLTTDRNGLADEINRSEVSAVSGDLAAAVGRAEKLLREAPTDQREIYVFTDLQKATWRPLAEQPKGPAPTMIIVDCGTGERENVALTEVKCSAVRPAVGMPLTFKARVKNFGERQKEGKVTLYVDRRERAERVVKVDPGAEADVSFSVTFDTPGTHSGWVDLKVDDILPLDNRRYLSLDVPERLRVALVREQEGAVPLLDETFFIFPALNPAAAGLSVSSAIAPEPMLRNELTKIRLTQYRTLYLLNLPLLSAAELRAVVGYLESGGSVVIFPGDAVDAGAWNALFKSTVPSERGFLPARFGKVLPDEANASAIVTLDKNAADFRHPILAPFERMASTFFSAVAMKHYFDLRIPQGSATRTLAALSDGRPFLLEKDVGEGGGRVMLFCTSATTRWSNLPARRFFLPLLHQMTYYLSRTRGVADSVTPGRPVRFGGVVALHGEKAGTSPVEVTGPRGVTTSAPLKKGEGTVAFPVFADTARPGIYTWRNRSDETKQGAFVVNVNTSEGDLTTLTHEAISEKMLTGRRAHFVRTADEARNVAMRLREGIRLRTPLLFIVIGLLILECILANQAPARKPEVRITAAGVTVS